MPRFEPSNQPSRFAATNKPRRINRRDYLVEIESVDPKSGTVLAHLVNDPKRRFEARVDPRKVERMAAAPPRAAQDATRVPVRFDPWKIDQRFASNNPPGTWLVLEGAQYAAGPRRPQDAPSAVTCGWIKQALRNPAKTMETVITLDPPRYSMDNPDVARPGGYVLWGGPMTAPRQRPRMLNPSLPEDEARLMAVVEEMNVAAASYIAATEPSERPGTYPVPRLVLLRDTVTETPNVKNKEEPSRRSREVITTTEALAWSPAQRDANNNIIAPGHPFSGDQLLTTYDELVTFAQNNFPNEPLSIEVLVGVHGPVSQRGDMTLGDHEYDVVRLLSTTRLPVDPVDTEFKASMTLGMHTVVWLSDDQKQPNGHVRPQNFLNGLGHYGYRTDVLSLIESSDGCALDVPPSMRPPRLERDEAAAATPGVPAPASTSGLDGFADDNVFGEDPDPAPATPPAASPAPATAAPAARTGWNRRT